MAGIVSDVMDAIGYAEGWSADRVAALPDSTDPSDATFVHVDVVTQGPEEPMSIQMIAGSSEWVSPVLTVDPYASLGGAAAVTPTVPTGIGLSPGFAGLAPAPAMSTPTKTTAPGMAGVFPGQAFPVLVEWAMGAFPLGEIVFEKIANRQAGGVRFGTLPMVVFQDNSGRGGY